MKKMAPSMNMAQQQILMQQMLAQLHPPDKKSKLDLS
jgi:hypothetical protein